MKLLSATLRSDVTLPLGWPRAPRKLLASDCEVLRLVGPILFVERNGEGHAFSPVAWEQLSYAPVPLPPMEISVEWEGNLCIICHEKPRSSAFSRTCGKSCAAKLRHQRRRDVERRRDG